MPLEAFWKKAQWGKIMYYTYIIQSQKSKTDYTGATEDLKERI